ncbi:hypothetical protein C8R47DRAFT_1303136, partial [Mycena vitilis]
MDASVCDQRGVVAAGGMTSDSVPATPTGSARQGGLNTAESRHQILLNSNELPLSSDVAVVQWAIAKADGRLAWLANEISQLRDRLQQLEQEQVFLPSLRAQNCSILSPLRRMPPEVLSEIFAWTLPSAWESCKRQKPRVTDSPWILTHVSHRWRAVAILNSSLWSIVAIKYPSGTDPSVHSLAMIKTQLARAQKLKVNFSGNQMSDPGPQMEMFRYLSKHASRWEELSPVLTSYLYPMLNDLRGRVPSLCRVSIRWDCEESWAGANSIDFLGSAPSLVDVDVLNSHRYIPVSFATQQLTRYCLDAPWEIHEGLLKLAINLVEAHITVKFDISPFPQSSEVVELSSVRRLYASTPQVFHRIRVPGLEELAVFYGGHRTTVAGDLKSLVARSACTLRRVCLSGCCHTSTNMAILQSVPSIVDLRIIITKDSVARAVNAFIKYLMVLPDSTPVIPQLSSLMMIPRTCKRESRWKSEECALSHTALIFQTPPIPSPPSLADFGTLRNEGFDFVLVTNTAEANNIMNGWVCFRLY